MNMKVRIAYQALLFFNSTLLYSFTVRSTGARDLLFFSAFIAALSLTANLAVQLSDTQFRSGIWSLKIASIALLSWVCLRTGITPPAFALVLGIVTIVATQRDALVGSPRPLSLPLAGAPILVTAVWTALAWGGLIAINGDAILMLLILPYLLTALLNRRRQPANASTDSGGERIHALTLIVSQLLPTASSFVMLALVSYEKDASAVASFVAMERAIAIGGSIIYFYARAKGALGPMATWSLTAFLTSATVILASITLPLPRPLIAACYLAAGCLLSLGTISLGSRYARSILAINGAALGAILIAIGFAAGFKPIHILAIYVCPQLLLMGGLVVFASRKNA